MSAKGRVVGMVGLGRVISTGARIIVEGEVASESSTNGAEASRRVLVTLGRTNDSRSREDGRTGTTEPKTRSVKWMMSDWVSFSRFL